MPCIGAPLSSVSMTKLLPGSIVTPAASVIVVHLHDGVTLSSVTGAVPPLVSVTVPRALVLGSMKPKSRRGGVTVIGGGASMAPS